MPWTRTRANPAPPPDPPPRKAFVCILAPWYSPVGEAGPLPAGEYCGLIQATFVVLGTDDLVDVFANGNVTVSLRFTDNPAAIRSRFAAAIRTQLGDQSLAVEFVTGGSA